MGADGGSIPSRQDLVKHSKLPDKKTIKEGKEEPYKKCTLTGLPLEEPILVLRKNGRLYNKESILIHLLKEKKEKNPSKRGGKELFKSLKEFTKLRLKSSKTAFICPITGNEMSSQEPFIYFPKCGCTSSLEGLKIITNTGNKDDKDKCPICDEDNCGSPFKINP